MKKLIEYSFLVLILLVSSYWTSSNKLSAAPTASLGDMTIHVVPQSHIDLAWWWRYDPQTIHIIIKHTLETAFGNMENFPDYTFSFMQVPAIEPMEELYPDLFYKLRYYSHCSEALDGRILNPRAEPRGKGGRLEIGSGVWCQTDGCVPCGESIVRQCLYGKRYYKQEFGIDVTTSWFGDAWTHPWTYPQILKKSGMDSYLFNRPFRGEKERMFWWQSPDGSRVFAFKPIWGKGGSLPPRKQLEDQLFESNKRYGVKDDIVTVGVGNHGGGAIRADVELMKKTMAERQMKSAVDDIPPKIEFSTPSKFLKAISSQSSDFPVVNTEISPTIRGAYTTVGEIKRGNRKSESLLMTLEKFSSIACALDELSYPQEQLNGYWQKVMLNQFHDTISGTDIAPSIEDALLRYREILDKGGADLQESLTAIGSRINTDRRGIPIIVYNPLSWERTGAVEMELCFSKPNKRFQVVDMESKQIPIQIIGQELRGGKYYVRFIFLAEGVPSVGYKSYWAIEGPNPLNYPNTLKASTNEIENEYFKVQIDAASGCIRSVYDKKNGREVLAKGGKGNRIQVIEDLGDSEGFLRTAEGRVDPRHKWAGESWDVESNPEIELLESGPVRVVLQVKSKYELARFRQRIILYPKIAKIDFDLAIDWDGEDKMVKVSFPTSVSASEATYEIPYGTIRRRSEGEEHNAQKWVDISGKDYGVSLLNDSRYGYDVKDNVIRLSVLRSPSGPAFATDEKGVHRIRYSLYPHRGIWQGAGVMQQGYELNYPLEAFVGTSHDGDLPPICSFVKIEPENVILTVIKKAEDSDDWILRFYETEGKKCMARVTLAESLAVDAVHKVDLLENGLEEIETDGRSFEVPVGAYSIESYKLIRDEAK